MTDSLDRRAFLKTAAAAAGAVTVTQMPAGSSVAAADAPAAAAAPAKPAGCVVYKSLKFGMFNEKGLSILDKFKILKDLGYDGVELDSPGGQNKKECRDASEKTGLIIDGVVDSTHWQIRLSAKDAATRERGLKDLLTAIEECHYCGGTSVLLVAGHGQDGTQEEVAARSAEQIQKALPLAAKLGVFILIENVWNHFTYDHNGPGDQTADAYAAFIDRCNSPWVGAQYDIGNHRKYGVPSQWLKTLGHRAVKLDAKDFNHTTNQWADIGEGTVDWDNVRAELAKLNFHGYAAAEVGGGDRNRMKVVKEQMDKVFGG